MNFTSYINNDFYQQPKPAECGIIRRGMSTYSGSSQYKDKQFSELSISGDEGYYTDSRSNTSASSPLSSSLSSLSTSEGYLSLDTGLSTTPVTKTYTQTSNHTSNMHSAPIQKSHSLSLNSRTNMSKNSGIPVKRRGVKVEEPVNTLSLEDRLRALTTIEEEEAGLSVNDRIKNSNNVLDTRSINHEKSITGPSHLRHFKTSPQDIHFETYPDYVSDYYRAQPVDIIAKDSHALSNFRDEEFRSLQSYYDSRNNYYQIRSHGGEASMSGMNGKSLKDYMQFLEKDSGVSVSNIDIVVQRESSGPGIENVNEMDINRRGLPASSRKQGFSLTQNNSRATSTPVMNDSGHYQIDERGPDGDHRSLHRHEGGEYSAQSADQESDVDSNGKVYNPGEIYLLRSVQNIHFEDPPKLSGHTSEVMLQNQILVQQEYLSQDHQQQEQQQQQYWQQQARYHEHAFPSNPQQRVSLPPLISNKDIYLDTSLQTPVDCSSSFEEMQNQSSRGHSSWQPGRSFDQQFVKFEQPAFTELRNSSLELENIPNLYRQISKTSHHQMPRKHIFASSADINKLFSGQKNSAASQQIPSCYQSDVTEENLKFSIQPQESRTLWSDSSQIAQELSKSKLWVMTQPVDDECDSTQAQIIVDHSVRIPPGAWTNVVSFPNFAESEVDISHFHSHSHSLPISDDLESSPAQRSLVSCTDLATDRSELHCMTSGYSSESELQQIESNAESNKKISKFQRVDNSKNDPMHEFMPLNRLIDQDSSVDTDSFENYEPVYENQSMVMESLTSDPSTQPFNSVWFPRTVQQGEQSFTHLQSNYSEDSPYLSSPQSRLQTRLSHFSSSASSFNNNSDVSYGNNIKIKNKNGHIQAITALNNKPTFVANHVTSASSRIQEYNNSSSDFKMETPASLFSHYHSQNIPFLPDLSEYSGNDHRSSLVLNSNFEHSISDSPHGYPQHNSSKFVKLSPVQMTNKLDIPFKTTLVCDEQGNRLSTLV